MLEAFIHGALLAFGLILPLGIQNIFIFNQGATQKRFGKALPAVITAAICDTLLISLAVAGVSVVVLRVEGMEQLLSLIGFFFLMYMGWIMWKSNPQDGQNEIGPYSARRQITFAASVSLFNPHAILDTIGVIGTSSVFYDAHEKVVFAFASILISWLWFLGLALVGSRVSQLMKSASLMKRLNQGSAFIIWGMAIYLVYRVFI